MKKKFTSYLYKLRIRSLLIGAILGFTALLFAAQFGALYAAVSDLLGNKVSEVTAATARQVGMRVESLLDSAEEVAVNVRMSEEISDFLNLPDDADYYSQIVINEKMQRLLGGIANTKEELTGIYILTDKLDIYNYASPNSIFELGRLAGDPIYQAIQEKSRGFVATRPNPFDTQAGHLDICSYFFNIYDRDNAFVASICVNLEEGRVRRIFGENGGARMMLFDSRGNLISPYSRDPEQREAAAAIHEKALEQSAGAGSFDMDLDGHSYLCIREDFGGGWMLLDLKDRRELMSGVGAILLVMAGIAAAGLGLTVVFAARFSRVVADPIKQLTDGLMQLDKDNLDVVFDESYDNEIGHINHQMNKIVERLKGMIQSVVEDQDKIRRSELKALQAQINPHFLYNSLDSINWMAIKIGAEDISTMANQLGTFFRRSLNKGRSMTTIGKELEHLRAYVAIQGYRYDSAFEYREDADPELMDCVTVHLILQPLVENSLLHGAKATGGACRITVTVRREGDDVAVAVTDDGCGCNSDLMNQCLEAGISMSDGYGVLNVHQRVRMAFGERYGLSYEKVGIGARAVLRFPITRERAEG